MKRFGLLLFVGLIVSAMMVHSVSYKKVKTQGAGTPNTGTYYLACDSSDTFQVDTFYSDTFDLLDYKYLDYFLAMTGFAMADSANDSAVIIVQGHGIFSGRLDSAVTFDTLPHTLGTLDSTEYAHGTLKFDTLPYNQFYFTTIVKDSFILGAGLDSSEFRFNYEVVQTGATTR